MEKNNHKGKNEKTTGGLNAQQRLETMDFWWYQFYQIFEILQQDSGLKSNSRECIANRQIRDLIEAAEAYMKGNQNGHMVKHVIATMKQRERGEMLIDEEKI